MNKLAHVTRILLLLLLGPFPCRAEVVVYPAPQGEDLSADYALEVDGQPVDIYLARVTDVKDSSDWLVKPGQLGGPYSFASFDMSDPVTVRVTSLKGDLDELVIRPVASGIKPTVNGNTATHQRGQNGRSPAVLQFDTPGLDFIIVPFRFIIRDIKLNRHRAPPGAQLIGLHDRSPQRAGRGRIAGLTIVGVEILTADNEDLRHLLGRENARQRPSPNRQRKSDQSQKQ